MGFQTVKCERGNFQGFPLVKYDSSNRIEFLGFGKEHH